MDDARITWSDLAGKLDLSPPATAERVRRLEERGVIAGYRAVPNPAAIGYELLAFVYVTLRRGRDRRDAFLKTVAKHPVVLECHHLAGDDDYLLKVRCRSMSELEELLSFQLKGRSGVARMRATIALGTVKETTSLPLEV
jgi:Lrp/AsnC family leucine-responsive transcriptional regulator